MRRIICGLRKAILVKQSKDTSHNGFLIPFLFGGHSELVPRLPIPNRTVKRLCADDSVDYPCESRSPPNSPFKALMLSHQGFIICASKHNQSSITNHLIYAPSPTLYRNYRTLRLSILIID